MNKSIVVPLDTQADDALDFGDISVNIEEWILTSKEFSILYKSGILEEISVNLNIILGEFEQQKIEYDLLLGLKSIIENFPTSMIDFELIRILKKLKNMINLAIKIKTNIYLFF